MAKNTGKNLIDKVTEGATNIAINTGAINGLFELSNYMNSQDFSDTSQLAAFGTGLATTYMANKKGIISKASKGANKLREKISKNIKPAIANTAAMAALGTALTFGGTGLSDELSEINKDFSKKPNEENIEKKEDKKDAKNYETNKNVSENKGINSSRLSMEGKFQRAKRFDNVYKKFEKEYGLPANTLGPLAMTESHGNPVQRNTPTKGDGPGDDGRGLYQLQSGMAEHYGYDTYSGSEYTGPDTTNAKKLNEIVEDYDYNYAKLSQVDDRFHIWKSSDVAAKYLSDLMERYDGDLEKSIMAYNKGPLDENKAENFEKFYGNHPHLERFQKCRNYYKENIK